MANPLQIKRQLTVRPFRTFWLETTGGNQIRVMRPEWFYDVPDSNGEFVVFSDSVVYVLNYRDILDDVTIEGPPRLEDHFVPRQGCAALFVDAHGRPRS